MGILQTNSNKNNIEYGDDIKKSTNEFIKFAERKISHSNSNLCTNSSGIENKIKLENSIRKDITNLKKISDRGAHLKVGILGRNYSLQSKLLNTLYLNGTQNYSNEHNTFISSESIRHSNIINNNEIDEDSEGSLARIMSHNFETTNHINSNLKFINKRPTPSIINDNLLVTSSSELKKIQKSYPSSSNNFEIELDDVIKFLLFSVLHDLIIYIPDDSNLDNEISYLEYISNNTLILKLLRRNSFFIILNKVTSKSSFSKFSFRDTSSNSRDDYKLQNLINKLGKTVLHELDYANAEKDKIKFLGAMLEKNGNVYLKGASFEEIDYISNKFDTILKSEDFYNYTKEKDELEKKEEEIFSKNPKYKKKKISRKTFNEFKKKYSRSVSNIFSTTSNLGSIEENLFQTLMNIINNKVSLYRSNISYKLLLYENYNELTSNNEFMNYLIIERNDMIKEMDSSFIKLKEIIDSEKNNMLAACEDLLESILNIENKSNSNSGEFLSSIFDVFNLTGNFLPQNQMIEDSRKKYFNFNDKIFQMITKISNISYKVLEMLSKKISIKYTQIFLELEKKKEVKLVKLFIDKEFMDTGEEHLKFNLNSNNSSIEEIIKFKLEKINLLSIHLLSVFGLNKFKLEKYYPLYIIPSYGGLFSMLTGLILLLKYRANFYLGGATLLMGASLFIFSFKLKNDYIKDTKENFNSNINELIKFILNKKDKIANFDTTFKKFYEIYSKECMEFIDLITGF